MLLSKITLNTELRNFNKNSVIEFKKNITTIVGNNGSGKSTIIDMITNKLATSIYDDNSAQDIGKTEFTLETSNDLKKGDFLLLDSVDGLLKTKSYFVDDKLNLQIKCMNSSSGEGLLLQLADLSKEDLDNKLLLLDEPERGLSLKQQNIISKYINFLSNNFENIQIIVVTHSFPIISLSDEVFYTDELKYISSKEYLDLQLS